jgi:hypothetical protein
VWAVSTFPTALFYLGCLAIQFHDRTLQVIRLIKRFLISVLKPITEVEIGSIEANSVLLQTDLRAPQKIGADNFNDGIAMFAVVIGH